jgi:8-amino-7-oxononanoate synthase
MDKLLKKLQQREKAGNLRSLSLSSGIDFYSNDYLGLAKNPELKKLIEEEFSKSGGKVNGSGGSRLLAGNNATFEEVEDFLASVFKTEKCLLFNSGYNANLSILSSVPQKGDTILYDELIHASLIDGARLSFANRYSFRHNDMDDLERLLQKTTGEKYIVAEAVYSMDGDFAPLKILIQICEKYQAHLILDEAHSTGTWGEKGAGLAISKGLENKIFARIYTFGKALGIHGACIAGSEVLIKFLINFARPFIYTTALPLHSVLSVKLAFQYLQTHPELQSSLHKKIGIFLRKANEKNLRPRFIFSESPVQAIKIPGNTEAKATATELINKGFDVRPILSPTVKEQEERLRICIHAFNTDKEISDLVDTISEIIA